MRGLIKNSSGLDGGYSIKPRFRKRLSVRPNLQDSPFICSPPSKPQRPKKPRRMKDISDEQWGVIYHDWESSFQQWDIDHASWKKAYRAYLELRAGVMGQRSKITADNIGEIYVQMFRGMYCGEIIGHTKEGHMFKVGEEVRSTSVDIEKRTGMGTYGTEVKAYGCGSRPACRVGQVENLSYWLMDKFLERGQESPQLDYAFFKYGGNRKNGRVRSYDSNGLASLLAGNTRSLIIAPLNLALLLCKCAKRYDHNHIYGGEGYFHLSARGLNILGGADNNALLNIANFLEFQDRAVTERLGVGTNSLAPLTTEDLFLGHLRIQRYTSSDVADKIKISGKSNGGTFCSVMNPFEITHYYMSPESNREWLQHFAKNRSFILAEWLGIRDLYGEAQKKGNIVPF